ncbi:MAG: hypothetical protein R2941_18905, partial [Desulfobacterales bacterium]
HGQKQSTLETENCLTLITVATEYKQGWVNGVNPSISIFPGFAPHSDIYSSLQVNNSQISLSKLWFEIFEPVILPMGLRSC